MLSPRRFLTRRWLLAFLGSAALLFGLAMLHPYPRQSLFGPKIRGKAWCEWEYNVRRFAHAEEPETTLLAKVRRWLGVKPENFEVEELFNHVEMFPLLLELADDPDVEVRRDVLSALTWCDQFRDDPAALSVLRRRLDDPDAMCRIDAAGAMYGLDKQAPVQEVLLRELHGEDFTIRCMALDVLTPMGQTHPELFPHLAKYATHENEGIRERTIRGLDLFGAKALPILCQALDDAYPEVREVAARALTRLKISGCDVTEAIPALVECLNGSEPRALAAAREALLAIDPERFKHLKEARD
jgi:HEAT repeat protein